MEVIAKSTGLLVIIVAVGSILLWAQDVIKIGAIYSLSGSVAEVGKQQKCAVEMAVKEVNDAGGIKIGEKRVRIKAIFGDDQGKPEIATQLFEDMVKNKHITAVIGGTAADISLALNDAAKKYKVFLISACATPGTCDISGFPDDSFVKAANQFSANFAKLCNERCDPLSLASYDSVKEVVRAIKLSQSTDPAKMYEALMANPVWTGAKGEAKWLKDGRCIYKHFDLVVKGKGPDERKERAFGSKYDFATVVDVLTGDAFAPTLRDLGY